MRTCGAPRAHLRTRPSGWSRATRHATNHQNRRGREAGWQLIRSDGAGNRNPASRFRFRPSRLRLRLRLRLSRIFGRRRNSSTNSTPFLSPVRARCSVFPASFLFYRLDCLVGIDRLPSSPRLDLTLSLVAATRIYPWRLGYILSHPHPHSIFLRLFLARR